MENKEEYKMIGRYEGANQIIQLLVFKGVDRLLLADALDEFRKNNPVD